jgi:anthrone oxygenase-like protein
MLASCLSRRAKNCVWVLSSGLCSKGRAFDGKVGFSGTTSVAAMRQIAEFVAVLACGLFAGAALYVSLVEHPARMECGVELAATEFPPSYRRGTIMQVTLAAVCLLSSIAAWLAGATFWWVVAGILQVSVIPFTLIVILPTNNRLLSPTLDKRSVDAKRLLARWGSLHSVRSLLSGLALLLFLCLVIFKKPL